MQNNKVKDFFKSKGLEDRIKEFDKSSATVELAAQAIGCLKEHIAKSLTFMVNGGAVLIVTAGDMKIDNRKFKDVFKEKAKMLTPLEVETLIGHFVGGVCPFCINEGVKVYLDISLKRFDIIYPACGSGNSVIKLTLDELMEYSGYLDWVDVCKSLN